MMINATFDNISAISWWSVLLREKTRVLGESHPHWPIDKLYRIMLYRVHDVELTSVLLSVGIELSNILLEGSLQFWTYLDFCLSFLRAFLLMMLFLCQNPFPKTKLFCVAVRVFVILNLILKIIYRKSTNW